MYLPHILENIRFLTLGLAGLRVITHSGSAVLQEISSLWGAVLSFSLLFSEIEACIAVGAFGTTILLHLD